MNAKTINLSELNDYTFNAICDSIKVFWWLLLIGEEDLKSEIAQFLRSPTIRKPNESVKFHFIGHEQSAWKIYGIKESFSKNDNLEHKERILSHYPTVLPHIIMRESTEQSTTNPIDLNKCDLYYFTEIKNK